MEEALSFETRLLDKLKKAESQSTLAVLEEEEEVVQKKERCFAGLGNQGATCYMNSLLQALYMLPEFRKMIYSWEHDPEKNAAKKDCILYQLQKLFATLQIIQKNAEEDEKALVRYADTTELTGSFQWDYRDAMQQHDVQEFFMQLFDAVEQSFEQNGTYGVIGDLYQGITTDFVRCKTCNYESTRDAKFFDLQLPVKNEFENISNSSVEEALKNYLNVETLTDGNKYECPTCNQKQEAQKGSKFVKLPKVLTLQLIRFTLDMQTFNRKKINDSVSFPLLLNMNHFLDEENCQDEALLKKLISLNPLNEVKKHMKKPETNLYKQQKDLKKKNEDENLNDMQQNFKKQLDDELRDTAMVDETAETPQAKGARERMEKRMKEREEHQKRLKEMKAAKTKKTAGAGEKAKARPKFDRSKLNTAFMSNAKSAKDDAQGWALDFSNETQNVAVKQGFSEEEQVNQAIAASMQDKPQDPSPATQAKKKMTIEQLIADGDLPASSEPKPVDKNKPVSMTPVSTAASSNDNRKSQAEMEKLIGKKLRELETQYLNEGQFVYELYGIMLQSGGAHGGHYSAYIKDFEEGDWYHFNDSFVKKISVTDLVDAFGRTETPKTRRLPQGANAYMLMYKLLDKSEDKINSIPIHEIPVELVEDVQSSAQQQQRQTISEIERKQKMQLKVIHAKMTGEDDFQEIGQAKVILVDRKVDTYTSMKKLIMKEYEVDEKDDALYRVRMYNVQFKILMDTYEGREDLTLEQLKIYPMKTMAFEQKESIDTPWKVYDPNLMQIRIILWEKDMAEKYFSLQTYSEEKSQRIKVSRDMKMSELKALLQSKFKLQSCILMKRTPMMQNQAVELYDGSTDSKGLNELRINEGLHLYAEDGKVEYETSQDEKPEFSKQGLSKWEIEFELEVNRYQIKFNLFDYSTYDQFVIIDRRLIVEQLKQAIASKIGVSLDNLIFRRGGNHGAELVDDDLTFKQANIYNMMSIYIEKGQPTRKGWKKLRFFVSELYNPDWTVQIQISEENEYFRDPHDHEFFSHQELTKIPVKTLCKVKDVKKQISEKFSEFYPQYAWLCDPKKFRLREKLSDKLTQAYHDDKILNTYSMHDDKEIAIQLIPQQDSQGDISEKQLVMIKFWDVESWELAMPIEIWVDKNASLKQFAEAIQTSLPKLEAKDISATKINSPWNFHRVQLPYVEWVPLMKEETRDNQLMQNPFYVSTDGILFIIKDGSKDSREMTADEREMYRCEDFEGNNMFNSNSGPVKDGKRRGPQEQGIKITVLPKQSEQPEEGPKHD